ncbi:MAG TPA: enoyl-CoA hydratase [Burkholderiales bacterium]
MSEDTKPLLVERDGRVVTLTWNRPQVLNAMNREGAQALLEELLRIEHDETVGCVVLAGAGRAFMAGGDLEVMRAQLPDPRAAIKGLLDPFHAAIRLIERMPQPVVAMVQGHAAGAGASLAFAVDFVVAAQSAAFTLSYAKVGTSPDGGATYYLARLVGLRRALEIAMLAEPIPAPRAHELGLVNRVVPDEQLQAETYALARRLAEGPAHAQAVTKRLLRESFDRQLPAQLDAEREGFLGCCITPDFAEGLQAFASKRAPKFGRRGRE